MPELEQALDYLEKARDNITREPDKCLIHIENAMREIRRHKEKLEGEVPF